MPKTAKKCNFKKIGMRENLGKNGRGGKNFGKMVGVYERGRGVYESSRGSTFGKMVGGSTKW